MTQKGYLMNRTKLAERLGFSPDTIKRWEDEGISPVFPEKKLNGRIEYTEDDLEKIRLWLISRKVKNHINGLLKKFNENNS